MVLNVSYIIAQEVVRIRTTIYWRGEISAAHKLALPYESKCTSLHGHNYLVEIWAEGQPNDEGMIIDYALIKNIVMEYDHCYLNDKLNQPTAEMLSIDIASKLTAANVSGIRVRVWEDKDSYAETELSK